MTRIHQVDTYINNHPQWQASLQQLRDILRATELQETLKWGAPTYCLDNKNLVGLAAFKDYVGLWFFQGVFLPDPLKVLVNAQQGKTKALRQWRFAEGQTIPSDDVRAYVAHAIQNHKAGKELKPQKNPHNAIPDELQHTLDADVQVANAFSALSPGKQREYADYIATAKQDVTKTRRLEKIIPMIVAGIGLNDKYRKC